MVVDKAISWDCDGDTGALMKGARPTEHLLGGDAWKGWHASNLPELVTVQPSDSAAVDSSHGSIILR